MDSLHERDPLHALITPQTLDIGRAVPRRVLFEIQWLTHSVVAEWNGDRPIESQTDISQVHLLATWLTRDGLGDDKQWASPLTIALSMTMWHFSGKLLITDVAPNELYFQCNRPATTWCCPTPLSLHTAAVIHTHQDEFIAYPRATHYFLLNFST